MIIGFLGKGGSGKSTISTAYVRFLIEKGNEVLAIDADHNMDLSFNLGLTEAENQLGNSLSDLKKYAGLSEKDHYSEAFFKETVADFRINPADMFTAKYARMVAPNLRVMVAGEHNQAILHGEVCSHSLFTPLKVYLPLLSLRENQYVVIDEKAGTDGAGTGIPSGFSFAFICTEPTLHSVKAAKQIAELLRFFETPYAFIINKQDDKRCIDGHKEFPEEAFFAMPFDQNIANGILSGAAKEELEKIHNYAKNFIAEKGDLRKTRSIQKFIRNRQFQD